MYIPWAYELIYDNGIEKIRCKDSGDIAILVSSGYGAGWSTWMHDACPEVIFDPFVVLKLIECNNNLTQNAYNEIMEYMERKYPDSYIGGISGLYVHWLDHGTRFKINEYDGAETVQTLDKTDWIVA